MRHLFLVDGIHPLYTGFRLLLYDLTGCLFRVTRIAQVLPIVRIEYAGRDDIVLVDFPIRVCTVLYFTRVSAFFRFAPYFLLSLIHI